MSTFKRGQKVRIKGTDIEGEVASDYRDDIVNVEVPALGGDEDLYILRERLEAVTEPITVTFDPVELPHTYVRYSIFGPANSIQVRTDASEHYVSLVVQRKAHEIADDREEILRSVPLAEARKLAYAILTITEAAK